MGGDFARAQRPAHAWRAHEFLQRSMLLARLGGSPFRDPLREAAVEHRGRVVSHPAQQPPQSARKQTRVLVVRDHLNAACNTKLAERATKRVRIRKRMASVRTG